MQSPALPKYDTERTAGIFRLQLFKSSEPFITDPAQRITRFRIVYIGRDRFGESPKGASSLALSDHPLRYRRLLPISTVLTRSPLPYVERLEAHKLALLHAHFGPDAVASLPLAQHLDIPLITSFHGYDVTIGSGHLLLSRRPSWWNYVLHRKQLAARGTTFLCTSNFIRDRVVSLGFPERSTRTHYIGVDTTSIRPENRCSPTPVVLHVARLVEKKGTVDLLAAFARVRRVVTQCELWIVGEGPLESTLRAQADHLGLTAAVRFFGARPHAETLSLMHQAWVFALPSVTARNGDAEGMGMVLLEAAASGVPAVATRHGGIPEAVADGESGLLCSEHDVGALSDSMIQLLRNDVLRRQIGHAARLRVERLFDLSRQCNVLERIYERAVTSSL